MNDEIRKLLFDVLESINSIDEYLKDKQSFGIYKSNKMLRRAVERELEIIGEAMNRIDKLTPSVNISGKKQIISMRNRVIHGYDKIDDELVWGIILRHLPVLKSEVEELMKK